MESNVISESKVFFSVGAEDRAITFGCSGIASLKDDLPLAALAGVDSAVLYEGFKSLDVAAAIADCKENGGYETFELLDSFSAPDSYGFYFIGKDPLGDELHYIYKNYGGFLDADGVIRVDLDIIVAPESMDRDDFIEVCEAVTNSLRLSDTGTAGAAPSTEMGGDFEVGGSFEPILEPLKGSTYKEQCAEIVDALFHFAPLACYDGPRIYLEQLLGGNEELFESLDYRGGLLEGEDNFTSEIIIEDCAQSPATGGVYYIDVTETRYYVEEKLGIDEYVYAFEVSINSPTDYCITGVAYQLVDHWGSTGAPVDEENNGSFDSADSSSNPSQDYGLDEPEAQRTYGTNARIDEHTYYTAIWGIKNGDYALAYNPYGAYNQYHDTCKWLEERGYTDTPLYDLALRRLALAYNRK